MGFYAKPSAKPNFIGLYMIIALIITLIIAIFSNGFNIRTSWVKMGWVGLGSRIFDPPNVGLGTYFRQPNQPNNPLGQGNPSGRPYRAGTLIKSCDISKSPIIAQAAISGSLELLIREIQS